MSEQPKWTPGPWSVHSGFPDHVVTAESAAKPIGGSVDPDGDANDYAREIALLRFSFPTRHAPEQLAPNARLIAAAPELYSALEIALTTILRLAQHRDTCPFYEERSGRGKAQCPPNPAYPEGIHVKAPGLQPNAPQCVRARWDKRKKAK